MPPSPAPAADVTWARDAAFAIWEHLAARGWAGRDPYDALNSRLIPKTLTRPRLAGRLLTQAVKRCPVPLQPLLAIKREADSYTLGHALLAAARLRKSADLAEACGEIVSRLRSMAVIEGESRAWSYHFPVQTRFFSYAAPTPNLITTAFVAKGMAAVTRVGLADCREGLRGAVTFVLEGLPRVADHTGQCIGYVPGETTVVHNANMLAALVLCEAASTGDVPRSQADADAWLEEALACARFTVARQGPDGSWPYSDEPYGRWVDGFHTGFVLEGLASVVRATGDQALRAALIRGLRYYVAQLFGPAGEPKYYPHRPYPLDALSAAQGVETLHSALHGTGLEDGAAQAVPGQLDWVKSHLLGSGGRVPYQVHRGWTDRREFPRWSSAPLMSALAGVSSGTLCSPGTGSRTSSCTQLRKQFCTKAADGDAEARAPTREYSGRPARPTAPLGSARSVWIDLANSPHVLFFQPVIAELHSRGVPTVVSARDFAQTVELCRLWNIDARVVGGHGGARLAGKAGSLVSRVRALRAFARSHSPCVAVSHNSYAQALAARTLGLPAVTAMDYEFQPANHLAFRCADLVVVPDVFPLDVLGRQGARLSKVWRYPGLKEEISLAGFVPEPGYLERAGISERGADDAAGTGPPVVVIRPPADMALYHRFQNPLFAELLQTLEETRREGRARVLLLPRTQPQAAALDGEGYGDLLWKGEALDGRQLIAAADAVISAGGSMNREAAVLGTPAYSIYAGKIAAIDRALIADGRLTLLRSSDDISALELRKKESAPPPCIGDALVKQFVDKLLGLASS